MNTVMEEKIKQAFQEWKQTEVKELIVETDSRNKQLSNTLLDMISKNPGITGKALRAYIAKEMPTVPVTYVPAILKGFYDKNFVNRIEVAPDGEKGRTTFSYTAIPVAVRKNMPKREKVKAYTKKVTSPLAVGATTLHITISTSLGAYSMQLEEAKFIYTQLNQIFGGVR